MAVGAYLMGWNGANWEKVNASYGAITVFNRSEAYDSPSDWYVNRVALHQDVGGGEFAQIGINSSLYVTLQGSLPSHDTPSSTTNWFPISGYASSSTPAAVTDADYSRIWTTLNGAVNIADGNSSITVDGTVAATQSGTWNVGTLTSITNTVTVGAAVGSPVFVRLSDGTNPISTVRVDNAGTFAVQAAQSGTWSVRSQDGAGNNLTSATRGSERALSVQIVDASGNQVTSFGGGSGGTQYTEGDIDTTITGNAMMFETNTGTSALGVVSSSNPLPVSGTFWQATQPVSGTVTANAGTGNFASNITQYGGSAVGASNALHVQPGTGASFTVAQATASNLNATVLNQYTRNGAATTALLDTTTATNNRPFPVLALSADGAAPFDTNSGAAAATTLRTVLSTRHEAAATPLSLRLSDGTNFIATLPVSLASVPSHPVTNAGTFAVQAAQSGTWNIGTVTSITNAVSIAANSSVNLSQFGGTNVVNGGTAGTQAIGGIQAHDAAISGNNPILCGSYYAVTPADVASGDVTRTWASPKGAFIMGGKYEASPPNWTFSGDTVYHLTLASDGRLRVDVDFTGKSIAMVGNVAHDAVDTGNPIKLGAKAIAHGANPTQVAAGDRTDLYANRHGILWTIGGHPNVQTKTTYISDASNAQTGTSLVGTIAAGSRVVVTSIAVTVDSAVTATGGVAVKIGFSTTTTLPADGTGVDAILLDHKGIVAGSGIVIGNGGGIIGIGADDAELRLTCEDPVGGGLSVTVTYYTIES